MVVYQDIESMPFIKNAVVTVGTFDGVHLAHCAVLDKVVQLAKEIRGTSVLITFLSHPKEVIDPDFQDDILLTIEEKNHHLQKTGIKTVIYLDFNSTVAKTYYYDFIKLLTTKMKIQKIVVGHDHNFGKNKEGNLLTLKRISPMYGGFEVIEVPQQEADGIEISSSYIRRLIGIGELKLANKLLGYRYSTIVSIVSGTNDFFVVKLVNEKKILPPQGVYEIEIEGKSTQLKINGKLCISRKKNMDFDAKKGKQLTVTFLN